MAINSFVIIIFIILISIIFFPLIKKYIRKHFILIFIGSIILFYLFFPPVVYYPPLLYLSGNKIIKKSLCIPPVLKCNSITKEKIMMELDISTRNITDGNKITFNVINIDPSFDPANNPNMILKLLTNMGINITNNKNAVYKDKKLEITTLDCGLNGNIIEEPCNLDTKIKSAYYNVSLPNSNGTPCIDIASNLSDSKKLNYTDWKYDPTVNKIIGKRPCGDIACSLRGSLIEEDCSSNIQSAYYNVYPSEGNGSSCLDLISSFTIDQKKGYDNWIYDNSNKAIKGIKNCIPNISCSLLSNTINENYSCDNNAKKQASYPVSKPSGNGSSCSTLISSLTYSQKGNYTDWVYDQSNNIIKGYKDCCPLGQLYYNGFCSSNISCPNGMFLSKDSKTCKNSCDITDKIDLIDKKCLDICVSPRNLIDGNICKDSCGTKQNYNGVCVD